MLTVKESWLTFDDAGESSSGKTKLWHVCSKEQGSVLGTIAWYGPWRKYAFSVIYCSNVVFEEDCLREIAQFCENKTFIHKQKAKQCQP